MASQIGSVVIGDYRYTLYDDGHAQARVTDMTKTSYGALQASVTHGGVTYALTHLYRCFEDCTSLTTAPSIPSGVRNMTGCFRRCTSLTTAPAIPSGVTIMDGCFSNCTSLTTAPAIPSGVAHMTMCFSNCTSLTTAPSIPSGVVNMRECFSNCLALTGTIAVHGTPTNYNGCFYDTTQPIVLVVTDSSEAPQWTQVAATGNNGNVTVRDVSANPAPTATITAVRVASASSTTPDETGQYAYVTVRTTVSTEQAPDNVAQAPTITLDGSAYTPLSPSGTDTYTCWVALGDEAKHVIGATPRDTYKTGTTVTVTLASTYSPMEFYQGGTGASFGKHATRSGVLDVAWDVESDGDVSAAGDMSGASVSATGDVTAGGKITADGEVAGSDCKSANYSLEDVGDSISQPTTGVPTSIGSAVGSSYIYWAKVGRLVMVNGSLRADQANANQRLMRGFPIPWTGTGVTSQVRAAAMKERTGGIYQAMINASGEICFDSLTGGTGWYLFNFCYLAAS